jgi:hypothetical protein
MEWKQRGTDNNSYEDTIYFISTLSTGCRLPLGSLTMEQYFSLNGSRIMRQTSVEEDGQGFSNNLVNANPTTVSF